jgi:outer membrane protein OmpA-like peptidoglycan-associated protein
MEPPDRRMWIAVAAGAFAGVLGSQVWRVQQPVQVALPQPLAVQVAGPITTNPQQGESPGNQIANDLLAQVMDTIAKARNAGIDAAKIPAMVITEITKGASSEIGKKFIDLVSYLATLPFTPSDDPQRDRERMLVLIRERIYLRPLSRDEPSPPLILETAQITFAPDDAKQWSADALETIRATAAQNPESIVLLFANTDTTGDAKRNADLARDRASTVRAALTQAGGLARNRVFVAELAMDALPRITGAHVAEARNRSVTVQVRR